MRKMKIKNLRGTPPPPFNWLFSWWLLLGCVVVDEWELLLFTKGLVERFEDCDDWELLSGFELFWFILEVKVDGDW